MRITFALITLNEERNLPRCLRSCADLADEIVILDSGSTDQTEKIAREHGARWKHQDWLGFVEQKNRLLSLAREDWVFSLDADEELSPKLREEVRQLKSAGPAEGVAGFSMPRCVFYEGRWIRHGDWYPDRILRLFERNRGRFAGGKVHERLEVSGPVRKLQGDLHHYSFEDAADHWERCAAYARLWAESKFEEGKRPGFGAPFLHALGRWARGYLLRCGFLDGLQGLQIASFSAGEVYLKYHLLRQMKRRQPEKAWNYSTRRALN